MSQISSTSRQPLPKHWVSKIFGRMQGLYGSLWLDKWKTGERGPEGDDLGVLNAMETWAYELGGFAGQPDRIKTALEACRSRSMPPNLPEFIEMCRQTHTEAYKAIPAPKLAPEVIDKRIEEMCATVGRPKTDFKKWAKDLREEYLAGKSLLPIQIEFASEALGETWKNRQCIENFSAPVEV